VKKKKKKGKKGEEGERQKGGRGMGSCIMCARELKSKNKSGAKSTRAS
jgi:hypothetical protein